MRVFVLTLGTRGDLTLLLALARELSGRGHQVTFGTSEFYADEVQAAGLEWAQIGDGSRQELLSVLRSASRTRDKTQRTYLYYALWLRPQLAAADDRIAAIAGRNDYFISGLKIVLRRGGKVFPGAAITYDLPADVAELARSPTRLADHQGAILELVAMSKSLVDPGEEWSDDYRFTGFWANEPSISSQPTRELMRFLEDGTPPVVITLGSMVPDNHRFLGVLIRALQISGQRGVLVRGWSGIAPPPMPDSIYCADEVPYDWLFTRVACVIHHGGCGTVAAVLRSAAPSIILPQIRSQENFGRLLLREQLATGLVDLEDLDAGALAEAIGRAIRDEGIRASLRRWRQIVSQEPGVAGAADLIEEHWGKLKP